VVLSRSLTAVAAVYAFWASVFVPTGARAQTQTLALHQPTNIRVIPEMNVNRQRFINYIFWEDLPDSVAAQIDPPDTSGWRALGSPNPQSALSVPLTSGAYTGTIDRTIVFRALDNGTVGSAPRLRITYNIVAEEFWENTVDVGTGYTADTAFPLVFVNKNDQSTLDLGIRLSFSPGLIDSNGVFTICAQDFEGFHMWRGIKADGSDLEVIGELSKQEAVTGSLDSLYYDGIIPALRATGKADLPFPVAGIGNTIDIRNIHPNGKLGPREFFWFDLNAFNGFTYRYTITSYDRGYGCKSHAQGLVKFDNCTVSEGTPYPCPNSLVSLATKVTPQNDLYKVYAVPNPYRSGSTQYSSPNYHNYPDNKMRFVNVPARCELRIYTPAGDLVWRTKNSSGTGNIEWDTRNEAGEEVSSGVYLYRLEADNGKAVYGRIVIIR
jgi:hypothetical protein